MKIVFRRGDDLLDQNKMYEAYVLGVGEKTYFIRLTQSDNGNWNEQVIDKAILEKSFYLKIDQEMGKLLFLNKLIQPSVEGVTGPQV